MRPGPPTTGPGFLTPKTSTETIPARVPWGPTERSRGRCPPRLLCRLAHGVTAPRGDCARAPDGRHLLHRPGQPFPKTGLAPSHEAGRCRRPACPCAHGSRRVQSHRLEGSTSLVVSPGFPTWRPRELGGTGEPFGPPSSEPCDVAGVVLARTAERQGQRV